MGWRGGDWEAQGRGRGRATGLQVGAGGDEGWGEMASQLMECEERAEARRGRSGLLSSAEKLAVVVVKM